MDNSAHPAKSGLSRRDVFKVSATSSLALLLAACGSQGSATGGGNASGGKPVRGGAFIYAMNLDIRTLDPCFSTNLSERWIYYAMFDTLVTYDKNFNIQPSLAKSWDIGEKTVTLHLRDDVRFHDGTPFNAEAAKWNLDRLIDPKTKSPNRGQLSPPLAGTTVVDEFTLQLDLERQWRPVLSALGERPGFMVSPTAAAKGADSFAKNPVGTGPFKFVSFAKDSELKVEKFADYWDVEKIYLDSISFKHVAEESQRVTMIRTGEAHAAQDVTAQIAQTVANDKNVVVEESRSGKWYSIMMDVNVAPFDKKEVRQAVAYATNRDGVKKATYLGKAVPAAGPVGSGWASDSNRTPMFGYDLDKAKGMITAAGASGAKVDWANSTKTDYQSIAQLVEQDLSAIGLALVSRSVPQTSWYDDVLADKVHFTVLNFTPRADVDGLLRLLLHSKGGQNATGYSNPEIDKMLDEAATIMDPEEAKPHYEKITKIIEEDAPYSWIVYPNYLFPRSAKVGGMQIYPDGITRIKELWLNS
jgi:peptide/nickel transport system substrate-binding protein